MSCPANGIRDFPVQNNVTVTNTLNESITEQPSVEIQWAKRGTVPTFQQNFFNEGVYGSAEQSTSLRFNGNTYALQFVKVAEPQHRGFLLAEDKPLAIGEIVMGFYSPAALTEKYVFLSIPILNKSTSSLSPYLESIRLDRLPGRPIGLDDLLPFSKDYTSYTTCLRKVTAGKSTAVQATVLVFRKGLLYPRSRLGEVVKKIKIPGPMGRVVSSTTPPALGSFPEGLVAKTESSLFLISSEADYRNYLRSSQLLDSSSRVPGARRTDSTDSYKCVPLKPDENVKNNRIIVDTDKGIPLSQVLKEKQEEAGEGKITPGMVERMIAVILGTAIGIFILSIFAYVFSRVTSDNTDVSFPWFMGKVKDMVPMFFVSLVVGIIGFLIGFFTSTT
jgi:hypothetical protein